MYAQNSLTLRRFSASDSGLARFFTTVAITFAILTFVVDEIRGNSIILQMGSFNLCAEDVAVIPLVVALVSRVDVGRFGLWRILLGLILLLASFNLLRGVSVDARAALFALRYNIVFLLVLGVTFTRWGTLRPVEYLAFPLVAASLMFIFLFSIRMMGANLLFVDPNSTGAIEIDSSEGRVINAATVTFLAAAAAFFISQGSRNSSNGLRRLAYWVLAGICLVVVLMSRQRTATTGAIVGVSALFILHPTLLGVKRAPRLLAISLVSVLLMVAVKAGDALDLLSDEYRNSLANRNTLNWRFDIWTEALAVYFRSDFWSQVFGRPIGEPLVLQLEQGEWRYSVHGTHVGFLLSYGILGSFLWVTLLLAALFAALRRRHHVLQMGDLEPAVAFCWLLILLIYGYSYEWGNGAGVFLAMAMLPLIRSSGTYAGGDAN